MKAGVFVTGTDTGVGKTLISAALVHGFAARGMTAAGMKPVAAGCRREPEGLVSEDVALLRDASNIELSADVINPYAFEPPLAPHIAAAQAGQGIDLGRIHEAFILAQQAVDILVVEGVGGFRVPLNDTQDTADLAVMLGLPVVLVVGMRLGCLNHALLSAEAIATRGLNLAGWVANCVQPEMEAFKENLVTLTGLIKAPCIGMVPFQSGIAYTGVAKQLKLELILPE